MNNRNIFSAGSLIVLALLFVGLVILSETTLHGWRLDLTENKQYTLNEGTANILAGMQEPVTIYFFFSEDASRELPQIRSYANWVIELLDEMVDRSGGALTVKRIDPRPFSPEEDQASQFGLQSVPVGGDPLYLGLAGSNSLDDVQTMPFLQPAKEQFLEYDLAKMVYTLSHPTLQRIGLLSGLDMAPGFDMATRQPRQAWVMYEQLNQLFDLENIPADSETLPQDLDLLFLVHPAELSESMRYELDQFVLGGGRLVAFLDPFAESDVGGDPSDPMSRLNAGGSSSLDGLLQAWGVQFDTSHVVGDLAYALQVSTGAGMPPVRHLGILSVQGDGLNQDDIVSADLEAVYMSSSGWFEPIDGAKSIFLPLVQSSENAAPLESSRLRFLANPEDLLSGFQPTGDRYALAARITGPAASAFESAPGEANGSAHREQSGEEGINVILYADTDILTDRLWVSQQNFLGQVLTNSFADNGTLVINSVDNLLGSQDLIGIRTRTSSSRPFDRVEQLRLEAEGQYRATEERLNMELEETERKLVELQSSRTEGDLTILNQEQQAELERFTEQKIQIRGDLRQVQHDLDRDIDALGTRLKVINIGVVPALVILAAMALGMRRRREAASR